MIPRQSIFHYKKNNFLLLLKELHKHEERSYSKIILHEFKRFLISCFNLAILICKHAYNIIFSGVTIDKVSPGADFYNAAPPSPRLSTKFCILSLPARKNFTNKKKKKKTDFTVKMRPKKWYAAPGKLILSPPKRDRPGRTVYNKNFLCPFAFVKKKKNRKCCIGYA